MNDQKQEIEFMKNMADEFKKFLIDSINEGHHENFGDHFEFMKTSLDAFIEMKNDESEV